MITYAGGSPRPVDPVPPIPAPIPAPIRAPIPGQKTREAIIAIVMGTLIVAVVIGVLLFVGSIGAAGGCGGG